ncbi:hypothetical protein MUU72_08535 [Streptomyces sp. RS10V-4]|uniref:hypothetical protein n=1 Tax=Streptomyces rhizoryzae TaxID=2932493 RepID=UPI002003A47D|nr:hypothetical protein [Streptomyces rhizoryzae]MCK7623143.1 hypothetical protein [Streptomyces rhizoryzae]
MPRSGLLIVGCCATTIVPDQDCVSVDLDRCPDEAWRQCADVLYGTGGPELARSLLGRYPGCLFVLLRAGSKGCVAAARTGMRMLTTIGGDHLDPGWDPVLLASLLHSWVVALRPLEALGSGLFLCAGRTYRFETSGAGAGAAGG